MTQSNAVRSGFAGPNDVGLRCGGRGGGAGGRLREFVSDCFRAIGRASRRGLTLVPRSEWRLTSWRFLSLIGKNAVSLKSLMAVGARPVPASGALKRSGPAPVARRARGGDRSTGRYSALRGRGGRRGEPS